MSSISCSPQERSVAGGAGALPWGLLCTCARHGRSGDSESSRPGAPGVDEAVDVSGYRPVCLGLPILSTPSHRGAPPCPAMMAGGRRNAGAAAASCCRCRMTAAMPVDRRSLRGALTSGSEYRSSPTPQSDGGFEPPISLRATPRPPRKGRAAVQRGVPRPTQRRAPPRAKADAETAHAARGSAQRPFATAERLPRPTASTSLTARRAGRGEGWRPATRVVRIANRANREAPKTAASCRRATASTSDCRATIPR